MLFGLSAGAEFRRRQAMDGAASGDTDGAGAEAFRAVAAPRRRGEPSSPKEMCQLGLSQEAMGQRDWQCREHPTAQFASMVRNARESMAGSSVSRFSAECSVAEGVEPAADSAARNGGVGCRESNPPFPSRQSRATRRRMEREIRRRFGEIDTDGDGFVSECDLMRYACSRKLPKAYVRCFIKNAMRTSQDAHSRGCGGDPCVSSPWSLRCAVDKILNMSFRGDGTGAAAGEGARRGIGLSWEDFRDFSLIRDDALSGHFMCLDSDGDGVISVTDLENGLERGCLPGEAERRRRRRNPVRRLVDRLRKKQRGCGPAVQSRASGCFAPKGERFPVGEEVSKSELAICMMSMARTKRRCKIDLNEFHDLCVLLPSPCMLLSYFNDSACCSSVDFGSSVQLSHGTSSRQVRGGFLNHAVAGALAGAVSRTAVAPFETVRLWQMVNGKGHPMKVALSIARAEGPRALWRGNAVNVMKAAPQKSIDFVAYDCFKTVLKRGALAGSGEFLAGALAGVTSLLTLYPLEVLRARQAVGSIKRMGVVASFRSIARDGGVASLYHGLTPSICAIIPEAALTYGLFDLCQKYGAKRFANVNPTVRAIASGVAASLAGMAASYPLETIARRLQIAGASSSAGGVSLVLREVMANGGLSTLYCGVLPATAKVIPMAVISFCTYDIVQRAISERTLVRQLDAEEGAEEAAQATCCAANVAKKQCTEMFAAAAPETE